MTERMVLAGWDEDAVLLNCEHCDWTFVGPAAARRCPHCAATTLTVMQTEVDYLPYVQPPELIAPFALDDSRREAALRGFARGIPLAPTDLSLAHLRARLQAFYLPQWLVDVDVEATWRAEAGFNYEIVSHEEHFDGERKRWQTHEITETRVRWQPRLGRLQRHYDNVPAPALEEEPVIRRHLGRFTSDEAVPFQTAAPDTGLVALPNRRPEDAWSEARSELGRRAQAECRQAIGADHMRDFRWTPRFGERRWTQLLLPLYATYYFDDDATPQPLWINGQSGRVYGVRRASMLRARGIATVLGLIAAVLILLGLGLAVGGFFLVSPDAQRFGLVALLFGLLAGGAAVLPLAVVWVFNRSHRHSGAGVFAR